MSAESIPKAPPAKDQAASDVQHYRAVLHELIDMGTDIARTIHAQVMGEAKAGTPPALAADLSQAFDRVARTVRRTVLLAQRVAAPPRPGVPDRTAARARILRASEDSIDRAAHHARVPLDTDALHAELHERLDRPEFELDLAHRSVDEIIIEIRRDLGLGLDDLPGVCPARRSTPQDVVALHARAAAPSGAAPPSRPRPAPIRRPVCPGAAPAEGGIGDAALLARLVPDG